MKNLYEDEEFLKFLKKEEHTDDVIEILTKNNGYSYSNGKWSVSADRNSFKLNNKGIKLAAKREEQLSEICFDVENKTVSLKVENTCIIRKSPKKG